MSAVVQNLRRVVPAADTDRLHLRPEPHTHTASILIKLQQLLRQVVLERMKVLDDERAGECAARNSDCCRCSGHDRVGALLLSIRANTERDENDQN